jgi:hypothetical protein
MEMKDGWGVTHERGTKVVKGYYLEKIILFLIENFP